MVFSLYCFLSFWRFFLSFYSIKDIHFNYILLNCSIRKFSKCIILSIRNISCIISISSLKVGVSGCSQRLVIFFFLTSMKRWWDVGGGSGVNWVSVKRRPWDTKEDNFSGFGKKDEYSDQWLFSRVKYVFVFLPDILLSGHNCDFLIKNRPLFFCVLQTD